MNCRAPRTRDAALIVALVAGGCGTPVSEFELGGYRYRSDGLTQWALPDDLREVSGLALDPDGRLFAHGDELAEVFEIDYRSGRLVKRFALGDPPLQGDFEGIVWAHGLLYLVTSDGTIVTAREGEDGAHVDFDRHVTDLGRRCEIEGLHHDEGPDVLLMPCKNPRHEALEGKVALVAWSLQSRRPAPDHDIQVPEPDGVRLHLSGVTRSSANGHLVLVAARETALIELTPEGGVRVYEADQARHPQMEGIAMSKNGDLIVTDEGAGRQGRLSVYRAEP